MLKEGVILSERYEIIARIGSGGMADVYKAQDHKLNRLVAVKVMKAEFREDTGFVQRFQKEAQAAAKLSHPNVVNVYDVGEDRGLYYIVMELVEGITLKNYIQKKGKLSVKEATSIAIQVSLGLEAAHNRGIIHRDVKPQNIMISTDGKVKLSDFGIAKAMNSNTITANVMGSVHYSSPEQVRGGISDAKSDIYSLGITMYEMVTGRVPFDGDSTVSIAIKHLQEEMVSPSRYTPDLPYSLEQIILKCTQKNPERRYHNVGELIEDLKHSLIDPQGNFVQIAPRAGAAAAAVRTPQNQQAPRRLSREEEERRERARRRREEEYDDDDDEDDDDDDDGKTGLEKAITIGGFLVGAVIVIILIVVIGNMTGLFHFGKSASSSSAASTSTSAEATPTAEASSSSEQVAVPNLLGMTVDEATAACNKLGIGVRQTSTAASEDYDSGQIINQTISEGTMVDKGTTIDVIVSSGKADVTVPTGLTGSTQADAEAALESAGLVPDIQLQYDDTVDVGNVISTSPAEGTSVPSGATVTLYVSKGRDTSNDVKVPDIVGQSKDSALATLDTMGIKYTTQTGSDSSQSNGVVLSVSPDVGETVDKTTDTVTVTINKTATKYVFNTPLSEPDGYNGGTVKLELVQGDKTTTIYEGEDPWTDGPFTTKVESDSGETAVINIYEDGTLIARYPNVTFTEES
ncbi:Stk1 family PASTA domain-containing Ser/Thr kinase [Bilifractor porci]|uniref:non-specific serine/threonine protein kinase n=1 Tax=Bilifractor porci TaxID=2606636 RepID=A0A7X2TNE1_9FIRM|nr:Stk1 family PASTA domain-containing Ser/Thr kinase [Bilifractor porci]MST82147.1 Stk1 family PASTA domain-containing Ser/Thr kinase [Bilifractor porci]